MVKPPFGIKESFYGVFCAMCVLCVLEIYCAVIWEIDVFFIALHNYGVNE
jgi:hypothetical protein